MREKYESLSVAVLRDIAKRRGIKNTSTMKKAQIVEAMLAEDAKEAGASLGKKTAPEQRAFLEKKPEDGAGVRQSARTQAPEEGQAGRSSSRSVRGEMGTESGHSENADKTEREKYEELDSGQTANGILEVMPDGYGFIRCENYLPGENDVYVSPSQIRRFNLKTGDIIMGNTRIKTQAEKFSALLYITTINGFHPSEAMRRKNFEDLTPIFPNSRIRLENGGNSMAMRIRGHCIPDREGTARYDCISAEGG